VAPSPHGQITLNQATLRPPGLGQRLDSRWVSGAICTGLFVVTLLLFSRVFAYDFVNYDDPDYVTSNEHVKAGLTLQGLGWAVRSREASNWHPLTWMSHMIDYSLFGDRPRGHHATSVVLHALNAVLAFLALRRLTGAFWTSALFAAWFAWHPLRVESVAWVAERKDVLSGFFFFVVLWSYGMYVERRRRGGENTKVWRFYALALVAFALGLMAKPMLVTVPGVLLLLDVWPLRRAVLAGETSAPGRSSVAAIVLEKLPFFALAVISSVATYFVQKGGGSVSEALNFPARLANAAVAVIRYLGKFAWPTDLAVLYPHPGFWPARTVIACAIAIVVISGIAVGQWRRRPWIAAGWLWYLGMLVPVIGLVQVGLQSMADRYTYLPMLGVEIALLWTLREVAATPTAARTWGIIAVAALAAVTARTWVQLGVWENSFTLFDHAIAVTEKNYLAHDNRGLFLFKAGKVDAAMADYRRALAINPTYLNANNNLGYALAQTGRPAEAIAPYRAALVANPNHLEVHNNLANALSDLGQLAEAMEHYEFVLSRQPDHVNALNGSAVVLAMQNRPLDAKARLEHSLRLAPNNASAHNNLGNVCSMLGLRDEAIAHYRRATELNPNEPHTFFLIGALLNQQEKFAEAAQSLQRALKLNPANSAAHAQLGLAWERLGRRSDALRELRIAVQQQPNDAQARAWLQAIEAAAAK
jgi:tetratricopeptide (TPR) repeat protein